MRKLNLFESIALASLVLSFSAPGFAREPRENDFVKILQESADNATPQEDGEVSAFHYQTEEEIKAEEEAEAKLAEENAKAAEAKRLAAEKEVQIQEELAAKQEIKELIEEEKSKAFRGFSVEGGLATRTNVNGALHLGGEFKSGLVPKNQSLLRANHSVTFGAKTLVNSNGIESYDLRLTGRKTSVPRAMAKMMLGYEPRDTDIPLDRIPNPVIKLGPFGKVKVDYLTDEYQLVYDKGTRRGQLTRGLGIEGDLVYGKNGQIRLPFRGKAKAGFATSRSDLNLIGAIEAAVTGETCATKKAELGEKKFCIYATPDAQLGGGVGPGGILASLGIEAGMFIERSKVTQVKRHQLKETMRLTAGVRYEPFVADLDNLDNAAGAFLTFKYDTDRLPGSAAVSAK